MLALHKFSLRLLISILVGGAFMVAAQAQGSAKVYKLAQAGIQFTVPAGWGVEKDKDGTVTVSKKENDTYVVIALIALPNDPSMDLEHEFATFSKALFDSIKKDWKTYKADAVSKDTQNGMSIMVQTFTGTKPDAGGELEGLVILIGASKPVGVFAQRTKKYSDTLGKETSDLLSSIRKIE
ncbi:MAG TPA: hypothetical protein VGP81_09225 [Pyrinomonadaceae bacterium]|jgi:hypothetical protein|nr:hypothetical protein [Pyrinomonadaceae bacterium]